MGRLRCGLEPEAVLKEANWKPPLQAASVRLRQRCLMPEANSHSCSFAVRTLDIELGPRILLQELKNKRAELSARRPRDTFGQSDAVVGDNDSVLVVGLIQASNRDRAMLPPAEGMFEGISQQFVNEQT